MNLIKLIPCQTILFWRLVAYTLGASGFSYAIGSSITDSIIAGIIGLILGVYMCTIKRILSSDVLITILGSILIALLGNLFIHFELGLQPISYITRSHD